MTLATGRTQHSRMLPLPVCALPLEKDAKASGGLIKWRGRVEGKTKVLLV